MFCEMKWVGSLIGLTKTLADLFPFIPMGVHVLPLILSSLLAEKDESNRITQSLIRFSDSTEELNSKKHFESVWQGCKK